MRGKYKNKRLIKDNSNNGVNTSHVSYVEVPVEVYEKDIRTRAKIRGVIAPLVIFVLILFVGVFLIVYGARADLFRDKSFVPTQATIVKYEWKYYPSSFTGDSYHPSGKSPYPVFSYVYEGEEYTVESRMAINPPPFEVGEEITIYVNPQKPTDIVTPLANKMFIYLGIGIIVASVLALCILVLHPILEAKYPTSHWHKFLTIYIPAMIFLWGIVIVYVALSGGVSNVTNSADMLILFLLLIVVAGFISTMMIRDMINKYRSYKKEKGEIRKEKEGK